MNTKLTLSIDSDVVKKAKKYAKEQDRSLSDLIESYLIGVTSDQEQLTQSTPITNQLRGAFNIPDEVSLIKFMNEKYKTQ